MKFFLSFIAPSKFIFHSIEKIYGYLTAARYNQIQRTDLLSLSDQIKNYKDNGNFNLIRIGSSHDGGYVMMTPLTNSCEVISLGIADNIDFEISLIDNRIVKSIRCFDGSISELPDSRTGIEFESKFVKANLQNNAVSLKDILASIQNDEVILKIDIEGDEWDVLSSLTISELSKFSQIIGEFHGLASTTSPSEFNKIVSVLRTLNTEFHLVNAHPNNWSPYRIIQGIPLPDVIELTFVNKRISPNVSVSVPTVVPGFDLNAPCNPNRFEYLFR